MNRIVRETAPCIGKELILENRVAVTLVGRHQDVDQQRGVITTFVLEIEVEGEAVELVTVPYCKDLDSLPILSRLRLSVV